MQKKTTDSNILEICKQLKEASKIAIFCHTRPDGDALGAGMALTCALNNAGKYAVMCCDDPAPAKYEYFEKLAQVKSKLPEDVRFDTFICVDCADVNRIGSFSTDFIAFKGRKINIDHHISNKKFADFNCVIECPATCQLLTEIFLQAGFEINKEIADLLMLGLLTDSGNFSHNDVSSKTFSVAAKLKECGADISNIGYLMFTRQSKARALLYSRVLNSMRFELDDKLVFMIVTQQDFEATDTDKSQTEHFVDFPLSIEGVEVSISLMEVKKQQYKASLRSKHVDVNAVAGKFGGGGHVLASGCMLMCELEEAVERLKYAVYQQL